MQNYGENIIDVTDYTMVPFLPHGTTSNALLLSVLACIPLLFFILICLLIFVCIQRKDFNKKLSSIRCSVHGAWSQTPNINAPSKPWNIQINCGCYLDRFVRCFKRKLRSRQTKKQTADIEGSPSGTSVWVSAHAVSIPQRLKSSQDSYRSNVSYTISAFIDFYTS